MPQFVTDNSRFQKTSRKC